MGTPEEATLVIALFKSSCAAVAVGVSFRAHRQIRIALVDLEIVTVLAAHTLHAQIEIADLLARV